MHLIQYYIILIHATNVDAIKPNWIIIIATIIDDINSWILYNKHAIIGIEFDQIPNDKYEYILFNNHSIIVALSNSLINNMNILQMITMQHVLMYQNPYKSIQLSVV